MSPRSCLPELAVSVMLVGCATGWAQEPSRMPRLEPGWAQKAQANAGVICETMSEIYLQHVDQLPTPPTLETGCISRRLNSHISRA